MGKVTIEISDDAAEHIIDGIGRIIGGLEQVSKGVATLRGGEPETKVRQTEDTVNDTVSLREFIAGVRDSVSEYVPVAAVTVKLDLKVTHTGALDPRGSQSLALSFPMLLK